MKVKVVRGNRGRYVLRWVDSSGKTKQRTLDLDARSSNRTKAYKLAADLESELRGDTSPNLLIPQSERDRVQGGNMPSTQDALTGEWESYKQYVIETHLSALSSNYKKSMLPIVNSYYKFASPANVKDVTPSRIRRWLASLRERDLSPSSIRSYWRNLSAFLRIAVEDGIIESVPRIRTPKVSTKMKGRPLVGEELDRLMTAVENKRPDDQWSDWKWLINGLWYSGLRISEAYKITWHESDFYIDMSKSHPVYVIQGDQKNGQHERLPIVPDFAEMLFEIRSSERHGNVFSFPGKTKSGQLSLEQTKKVLRVLGKDAKIKTSKSKMATAHDFRRSFGTRWALKVMPQILQKLMRHSDIKTTLTFYAHLDADLILESLLGDRNEENDRSKK